MRILIVVPPTRKDFYSFLVGDVQNEYILLWYNHEEELEQEIGTLPPFFHGVTYWRNYSNPSQLLDKINPDRIVLYEIIDQQQIALIIEAKNKRITTFYLEHGAAGDAATALERSRQKDAFSLKRTFSKFGKLRHSLLSVIRTKLFYYSCIFRLQSSRSFVNFLTLPFVQTIYGPNKALRQRIFYERVPDYSIVFNRVNFRQFQLYTGIKEEDAVFTGVPMFDAFYDTSGIEEDCIIYIEQPFLEVGFMSWTPAYHESIARKLYCFAIENKVKLFVKLHPYSDKSLWDSYSLHSPYFEILQEGDFINLYLRSKLILGYASSLVTGLLCAKKNVVLLGWHPEKRIAGNDFSQTGLCHISLDIEEINSKFDYWLTNNKALQNEQLYTAYLFQYNFPFDGQATKRVIESFSKSKYNVTSEQN